MVIKDILDFMKKSKMEYEFTGEENTVINGYSSLTQYKKNTITWVKNVKNISNGIDENIVCAVIQKNVDINIPNKIISPNSKKVFFAILEHFWGKNLTSMASGVGEGSFISKSVTFDESVCIGRNCYIEGKIQIGKNTIIGNNVTILNNVSIGEDCVIQTGAVIGKDGDGYTFGEEKIPERVMHFGGVQLGNRVEVGANTCIDRGTIDDTLISNDTKIASLVVIGHNAKIGRGVLILGGAIICGSAEIGDGCYIAPGAIVRNQVKICKDSFIGLNTVAEKEISERTMVYDVPPKTVKIPNYRILL